MESTAYISLDSHSIGVRCLHCNAIKFGSPLLTVGNLGVFSYLSLSCKSCHKETFVGIDIVDGEVSVSVRDSE
jgi:hypothetical protein